MLDKLWSNIRNILTALATLVAGAFALLFLYTRNKYQIDEVILKEQELNKSLEKHDENIEKNNEELAKEEAYRKELEKNETSNSNIIDISKRINK